MASEIAAEDRELLERVARRLVELRLEVPAVLAIESGRPLSVLAGQAMLFLEPFVLAILRTRDYRRFAGLVERREALDHLLHAIETQAEAGNRARRAAAAARRTRT
jgi:hypothetical protein